jgi:putative FmdB family regulatory protein
MPLYEYKCSKCGEIFEVLQKFSDAPLKRHKGCRGSLHRLVSAAGLQFKGSGWYVNDYASSRGGNSESKTDSSGESKSESKTESKTESKSSESKSSESKSGSSDTKPAAKETKTESKPAKTP